MKPRPAKPLHLPDHSETCLRALVDGGLAGRIVLGGALGLLHYLDYRPTKDVDAWWAEPIGAEEEREVVQAVESALRASGSVRTRAWGDVVSIELQEANKTVFSFQIARRSAVLEPPVTVLWTEVPLDSFADLVAGKMTALVERGAPRDFRDIHALCQAGLVGVAACWALWERRQELAGSDADRGRARLAVETHLMRIVQHRPAAAIADKEQQAEAEQLRTWFGEVFLRA